MRTNPNRSTQRACRIGAARRRADMAEAAVHRSGLVLWMCSFLGVFACSAPIANAGLLAFPIGANQRATVTCLETPSITYDIYLPPGYSTNGMALPIVYTFNPSGGGYVAQYQTVCASLNMIVVGVVGSSNNATWETIYKEYFAVTRDVRRRVLFDPSAEFLAGFSGGAWSCFSCARARPQHVAGIFVCGSWMGRNYLYYSTDRVQTNLLVARASGLTDTAALDRIVPDSNYLATCNVVLRDWYYSGGHALAPDSTKTECLTWLLNNRVPARPNDRANAQALANDWQQRIAAGESAAVLHECMAVMMAQPRTWASLQAQLTLDSLTANFTAFRSLPMENLAAGDYAVDALYFLARASPLYNDTQRYRSYMKALTGITGSSGDRAGHIRSLLLTNGYVAPILGIRQSNDPPATVLYVTKDTPGLDYLVQSQTNLASAWQDVYPAASQTGTTWSAPVNGKPGVNAEIFRVRASPSDAPQPTPD